MSEDPFIWLQRFFLSNCDGAWEHEFGCKIDTMSDPGWVLRFDLTGTSYEARSLEKLEDRRAPLDWLKCKVSDGVFEGQCSPRRLGELIELLRDFVEGRRGTPA